MREVKQKEVGNIYTGKKMRIRDWRMEEIHVKA